MRRLVIDTSIEYLYVSIINDDVVEGERFVLGNNDHSENLADVLAQMLKDASLEVQDFQEIYVGRGPGSYTGVRVCGTIAKVLAFSCHIPLFTFSSLDLIASSELNKDGIYLFKINAKRGYHYAKVVEMKDGVVTEILPECFIEDNLLDEQMKSYPQLQVAEDKTVSKYDPLKLIKLGMFVKETDVNAYVPNYLRRGV